jgi:hypothetical protein
MPNEEYTQAVKNVERIARSSQIWIRSLPALRIMSVSKSRAFHLSFANSLLMGDYPEHGYLDPAPPLLSDAQQNRAEEDQ